MRLLPGRIMQKQANTEFIDLHMRNIDYSLYLVTGRSLLPKNKVHDSTPHLNPFLLRLTTCQEYLESLEEVINGSNCNQFCFLNRDRYSQLKVESQWCRCEIKKSIPRKCVECFFYQPISELTIIFSLSISLRFQNPSATNTISLFSSTTASMSPLLSTPMVSTLGKQT